MDTSSLRWPLRPQHSALSSLSAMLFRDPLLTLVVMVFAHSCMTLLLRRLTGAHNLKRRLIDACLAGDAITITALVAFFLAGSVSQFSMIAAMFLHFAPLGVLYQVAAFHFYSMPTLSSHRSTFLMPVAICAACSMLVAAGFFLSSPLGIVAESDVQLPHKTLMRSVIFALFSAMVASIAYWHILSRVATLGHARRAELIHLRVSRVLVLACAWCALILSLGKLLPVHLSAREQVWTNLVGSSSFSSFSFVIGDAAAAWLDQAMVFIFANAPATTLFIYLILRLHMSAMIASPNFVPLDRARLIELRALLIDIIVRQQQFEFQRSGSVVTAVANSFGIDPASQPLAPELARALQKIESDLVDVFLQSATSSSSNTEVRNMIDQASIEDNGGAVELPTELDTADQLSMEKRAFLRNVTHCLRTPLHAVITFNSTLLSSEGWLSTPLNQQVIQSTSKTDSTQPLANWQRAQVSHSIVDAQNLLRSLDNLLELSGADLIEPTVSPSQKLQTPLASGVEMVCPPNQATPMPSRLSVSELPRKKEKAFMDLSTLVDELLEAETHRASLARCELVVDICPPLTAHTILAIESRYFLQGVGGILETAIERAGVESKGQRNELCLRISCLPGTESRVRDALLSSPGSANSIPACLCVEIYSIGTTLNDLEHRQLWAPLLGHSTIVTDSVIACSPTISGRNSAPRTPRSGSSSGGSSPRPSRAEAIKHAKNFLRSFGRPEEPTTPTKGRVDDTDHNSLLLLSRHAIGKMSGAVRLVVGAQPGTRALFAGDAGAVVQILLPIDLQVLPEVRLSVLRLLSTHEKAESRSDASGATVRLDVSRYTAVRLDSTCQAWCTKDTGVIGAFIAALQSERVAKSLSELLVAICLPSSQLTAMLERELVRYGASVLTFNASTFSSRFVQSTATKEIPRFTALMLGEDMLVNPTGANTMSSFARSLLTELEQRRLPAPTCCIGLVDIVRFRGYDASHESLPDGDRQMLHRSLNTLRLSSKATPSARSPSPADALLRRSVYFSMISPVRTLELIHHFEALCNSDETTQTFNVVSSVPSETVSRNPLSAHLWNSQPTMSTEEASRLRTLAARSSFLMGSPSDHLPPPARSAIQIRMINTNETAPTPSTKSSQSSAAPSPLIENSKAALGSPDGPSGSIVSPSTSSSSPAQSLSSNTSHSPVTPNSSNRMLSGLPAIPLRMLVVDDMPFNQKALHMQLRSALGTANAALTSFDFADDGAQAVALVKAAKAGTQGPYDLIWMDLHMPVMDGVDAIRTIRQFEVEQRQAGSNINQYIVAITANNQVDDQNRSLAAGATVFIAKPAPPAKIKQVLQDVCERRLGGSPRR